MSKVSEYFEPHIYFPNEFPPPEEQTDFILYRALIEIDVNDDECDVKGKNLVEFSLGALVNTIIEYGDSWHLHHAHKCYPPTIFNNKTRQWDYKKTESITDLVKQTIKKQKEE